MSIEYAASKVDSAPIVAPVVQLGENPDPALVRRIVQQLSGDSLPATWIFTATRQAAELPVDFADSAKTAVGVTLPAVASAHIADEVQWAVARGATLAAVHATEPISRTTLTALHACGVPALIVDAAPGPSVRQLPLGIWQVTVGIAAPSRSRLADFFGKSPIQMVDAIGRGVHVVSFDLERSAATPRAWRQTEKVLRQITAAAAGDRIRVETIAGAITALNANCHARPQRSILRAA